MKTCTVGPQTRQMLELGHPWVIADRYTKQWPKGQAGDLIALTGEDGQFLACALYDPGDRIVARVLSSERINLNSAWFEQKLQAAKRLRKQHARLGETDAYRLVNGEGDGLPGLTVDSYAGFLMVQLYSRAWDAHLATLLEPLERVFSPRGICRKLRPQETRRLEAKGAAKDYSRLIAGKQAPESLQVRENGLSFLVDLRHGLNTGLFPDQRVNRRELMARAAGCRVLNLFAFTGAFSVAAASAGAEQVTSIDVSARYLETARENFALNHLDPERYEFIAGDVFVELERLRRQERRYDIILFDPPSFSTTKKSRFSTHGGTSRLVDETLPLLEPGGLLMSSSNHQKVTWEEYLKELRRGALQAGMPLQTLLCLGQPEDFPCPVSFPEGRYLKFVISTTAAC